MKLSIRYLLLGCLLANPAFSQPAIAPRHSLVVLTCDQAQVEADTTQILVVDRGYQVTQQLLTLRHPLLQGKKILPQQGHRFRQPFLQSSAVLDAYVSGWACLTASDGKKYLYFSYVCTEARQRPDCAGRKREWGMLFTLMGESLMPKSAPAEPVLQALMEELGLATYLSEGIVLADASE